MSLILELNLDRSVIKMSPNKTLGEALNDFCIAKGLDVNEYVLLMNKQEVDLSVTFRLSGIRSNTKLIVQKKINNGNAEVRIALDVEGNRYKFTFPPSISLWDMIKLFEFNENLNITKREVVKNNVSFYVQPCIQFTQKMIKTNSELRNTTLSSLGIRDGSVLLRLSFVETNLTLEEFNNQEKESMVEEQKLLDERNKKIEERKIKQEMDRKRTEEESNRIKQLLAQEKKKKEEEERLKFEQKKDNNHEQEEIKLIERDDESVKMQQEREDLERIQREKEEEEQRRIKAQKELQRYREKVKNNRLQSNEEKEKIMIDRETRVFSPVSDFDLKKYIKSISKIHNSQYELSPKDVQTEMAIQKVKNREKLMLKPKSVREKERLMQISSIKTVIIRYKFPNDITVQANFHITEPLSHLYDYMSNEVLVDMKLPYELFVTPPKKVIERNSNVILRDSGLIPAAIVYVQIEGEDYIKQELIDKMENEKIDIIEYDSKPLDEVEEIMDAESEDEGKDRPYFIPSEEIKGEEKKKKGPKWFVGAFNKKK